MTTPGDQAKTLRTAIERQQQQREAMKQTSEEIARERAQAAPAEQDQTEEQ